jgi:hypothetical protein
MKWLAMLLIPLTLAACEVGRIRLPMTLGPNDASRASCARSADTPVYGDCKAPAALSNSHQTQ